MRTLWEFWARKGRPGPAGQGSVVTGPALPVPLGMYLCRAKSNLWCPHVSMVCFNAAPFQSHHPVLDVRRAQGGMNHHPPSELWAPLSGEHRVIPGRRGQENSGLGVRAFWWGHREACPLGCS